MKHTIRYPRHDSRLPRTLKRMNIPLRYRRKIIAILRETAIKCNFAIERLMLFFRMLADLVCRYSNTAALLVLGTALIIAIATLPKVGAILATIAMCFILIASIAMLFVDAVNDMRERKLKDIFAEMQQLFGEYAKPGVPA